MLNDRGVQALAVAAVSWYAINSNKHRIPVVFNADGSSRYPYVNSYTLAAAIGFAFYYYMGRESMPVRYHGMGYAEGHNDLMPNSSF